MQACKLARSTFKQKDDKNARSAGYACPFRPLITYTKNLPIKTLSAPPEPRKLLFSGSNRLFDGGNAYLAGGLSIGAWSFNLFKSSATLVLIPSSD